jgi:hypothetical protein
LYWVVAEDGTKKSKDPIPRERAEAQMRALYSAMRREGGVSIPKKEFVKEHLKLLNIFKHPTKKALQSEFQDQSKELKKVLKANHHKLKPVMVGGNKMVSMNIDAD